MNPIILWAGISGLVGIGVGFFGGRGASGIGNTIKYSVIGAAAIIVAKQTGVLK